MVDHRHHLKQGLPLGRVHELQQLWEGTAVPERLLEEEESPEKNGKPRLPRGKCRLHHQMDLLLISSFATSFNCHHNLLQFRGVAIIESSKTLRVEDIKDSEGGVSQGVAKDPFDQG